MPWSIAEGRRPRPRTPGSAWSSTTTKPPTAEPGRAPRARPGPRRRCPRRAAASATPFDGRRRQRLVDGPCRKRTRSSSRSKRSNASRTRLRSACSSAIVSSTACASLRAAPVWHGTRRPPTPCGRAARGPRGSRAGRCAAAAAAGAALDEVAGHALGADASRHARGGRGGPAHRRVRQEAVVAVDRRRGRAGRAGGGAAARTRRAGLAPGRARGRSRPARRCARTGEVLEPHLVLEVVLVEQRALQQLEVAARDRVRRVAGCARSCCAGRICARSRVDLRHLEQRPLPVAALDADRAPRASSGLPASRSSSTTMARPKYTGTTRCAPGGRTRRGSPRAPSSRRCGGRPRPRRCTSSGSRRPSRAAPSCPGCMPARRYGWRNSSGIWSGA